MPSPGNNVRSLDRKLKMFDAEWLTFGNYTFSLRSLAFFYLDRLLEFTPSKMSVNLVQDDMQICEVVSMSS